MLKRCLSCGLPTENPMVCNACIERARARNLLEIPQEDIISNQNRVYPVLTEKENEHG